MPICFHNINIKITASRRSQYHVSLAKLTSKTRGKVSFGRFSILIPVQRVKSAATPTPHRCIPTSTLKRRDVFVSILRTQFNKDNKKIRFPWLSNHSEESNMRNLIFFLIEFPFDLYLVSGIKRSICAACCVNNARRVQVVQHAI